MLVERFYSHVLINYDITITADSVKQLKTINKNTRARVFIHCFLVFGYPGETLALVHILHN